jgi:hypothetical protein
MVAPRAALEGSREMMRKPDKALFGYPVASTQGRTTAASALTDEHSDEPGVKLKKSPRL